MNPVNKKKVQKYLPQIRPLVDGGLIEDVDPFNESYLWNPKKKGKYPGKELIQKISSWSFWGYPSLFKPSIAEVINSIPDNVIDQVDFFEITGSPSIVGECHVFEVSLFKRAQKLEHKKPIEKEDGSVDYSHMDRADFIAEIERRGKVAEKIWGAITSIYGQEGFVAVLKRVDPNAFKLNGGLNGK